MLRATLLTASALVLAGCQAIPLALTEPVQPAAAPAKPAAPAAADKGTAMAQAGLLAPMVERRETLTGTGYAVISVQNHRTAAQQRLMAIRASRLDAYRSLAEQVYGQYLDANTTVADMVVMSDTFRSRVEGVIYGAVLVSITPVGDDTYETTLSLDRGVVEDLRALYLNQLAARRN